MKQLTPKEQANNADHALRGATLALTAVSVACLFTQNVVMGLSTLAAAVACITLAWVLAYVFDLESWS